MIHFKKRQIVYSKNLIDKRCFLNVNKDNNNKIDKHKAIIKFATTIQKIKYSLKGYKESLEKLINTILNDKNY